MIKKLLNKIKKYNFARKLNYTKLKNLSSLGSNYGGWSFVDQNELYGTTIISAGLGEDASFDIEFLNKYNAKIIIVDPTRRAISHFKEILENKGAKKTKEYSMHGKQEMQSYDLDKVNNENFILIDKALYNQDDVELSFFAPPNKEHVSYSINNWQNNYKKDTESVKVNSITIKKIINDFKIEQLNLIKMDIEGVATEVLENMLDNNIFPKQICVEFDELYTITDIMQKRFYHIHQRLIRKQYFLIKIKNNFPNMLYVHNSVIEKK